MAKCSRKLLASAALLLVSIIPVLGGPETDIHSQFISMLSASYIDNVSELPKTEHYIPDMNLQFSSQKTIKTYVDIVGFRDMIREDGVDYMPGIPAHYAIVKYDATVRTYSKLYDSFNCYWCGMDSVTKDVNVSQEGNKVIAVLTVVFRWHETVCEGASCSTIYYSDSLSIRDSEIAPKIYPKINASVPVVITVYNNTFEPKTTIDFTVPDYSKVTVSYRGNRITHQKKIALVEYTAKNVPFGNVTYVDSWDRQGNEVSHVGDTILINGTAQPEEIGIEASTPYETVKLTNYTVKTENPTSAFSPLFIPFGLVLLGLYWGTSKILRTI
jgi:hypothetical protein